MILSAREFRTNDIQGLQIFICKAWIHPIESPALMCFQNFDEYLNKFRFDPEVTHTYLYDYKDSKAATQLDNGSKIALRSLPPVIREDCQLYTLAATPLSVLSNTKGFLKSLTENREGELGTLVHENSSRPWHEFIKDPNLSCLYLTLEPFNLEKFISQQTLEPSLTPMQHFRLSSLLSTHKANPFVISLDL